MPISHQAAHSSEVESLDLSQPHSSSATLDKHSMFMPSNSQQQGMKRSHIFENSHPSIDDTDLMSKQINVLDEQLKVAKIKQ
ncbi:hypothetical protein O3P69_014593 [Scylla paramamosain]|uniref:Uncharacterized protein n=1 Tax=Scylla paramamosain TaxID=85552 RepID=A0AAW0U0A3_SCYPA